MKRVFTLLLTLLILVMLLPGCIGEKIANTDKSVGMVSFSGTWPENTWNEDSEDSEVSKSIYSETGSITLILTNGTVTRTKTVSRSSSQEEFTISFLEVLVGAWTLTLEIYDLTGEKVGSKSQTINVIEGDNSVSIVMLPTDYTIGPANYAELFLPDSFPRWIGSISYHYEMMGYLDVDEIEVGLADAYVDTDNNSYFYKGQVYYWGWVNNLSEGDSSSSESSIYVGDVATGSGIVATMDYTYTGEMVTSAAYENTASFTQTASITYTDAGRIDTMTETVGTTSSSITFAYSGGNVSSVYFEGSDEPYSLNYWSESVSKLESDTEADNNGNVQRENSYTWNSSNSEQLQQSVMTEYDVNDEDGDNNITEKRYEYVTDCTYNSSDQLTQAVRTGTSYLDDSSDWQHTFEYVYDSTTGVIDYFTMSEEEEEPDSSSDYNNNDTQDKYTTKKVTVDFEYDSSNRVVRVDYILDDYSYAYNEGEYDLTTSSETMFYELISYVEDAATEVVVEIK